MENENIFDYWMRLSNDLSIRFPGQQCKSIWKWDHFKKEMQQLSNKMTAGSTEIDIFGLTLNLETMKAWDRITDLPLDRDRLLIYLYYYSQAKDQGLANEWVSFSSLPGTSGSGITPFQKELNKLTDQFATDPDLVIKGLEKLKGTLSSYGDIAFRLMPLPNLELLIILHYKDDEFPAKIQLLYDKNAIYYLPSEMLWTLAGLLVSRLLLIAELHNDTH